MSLVPSYYRSQLLQQAQQSWNNVPEAQRNLVADLNLMKQVEDLEERMYGLYASDITKYTAQYQAALKALWTTVWNEITIRYQQMQLKQQQAAAAAAAAAAAQRELVAKAQQAQQQQQAQQKLQQQQQQQQQSAAATGSAGTAAAQQPAAAARPASTAAGVAGGAAQPVSPPLPPESAEMLRSAVNAAKERKDFQEMIYLFFKIHDMKITKIASQLNQGGVHVSAAEPMPPLSSVPPSLHDLYRTYQAYMEQRRVGARVKHVIYLKDYSQPTTHDYTEFQAITPLAEQCSKFVREFRSREESAEWVDACLRQFHASDKEWFFLPKEKQLELEAARKARDGQGPTEGAARPSLPPLQSLENACGGALPGEEPASVLPFLPSSRIPQQLQSMGPPPQVLPPLWLSNSWGDRGMGGTAAQLAEAGWEHSQWLEAAWKSDWARAADDGKTKA